MAFWSGLDAATQQAIIQRASNGEPLSTLANEYQLKVESLGRALRRARAAGMAPNYAPPGRHGPLVASIPLPIPESVMPLLTQAPVVTAETVLVVADLHIPYHDALKIRQAVAVGLGFGATHVIVAGDMYDLKQYGKWYIGHPNQPISADLAVGRPIFKLLYDNFPGGIVYFVGNHERRLLIRILLDQLDVVDLQEMLTGLTERITFSSYSYCTVISGGQQWRVTHPKSFSRVRGTVANKLAVIHHANIAMSHSHFVNKSRDDSGEFTTVDLGGLYSAERLAYRQMDDSTLPASSSGFLVIHRGHGYLFDFNDVDWEVWRKWLGVDIPTE